MFAQFLAISLVLAPAATTADPETDPMGPGEPIAPATPDSIPDLQLSPTMSAAQANRPRVLAGAAFDAGRQAFNKGDYQTAIAHFERAQDLVPHPDTQYNLGMALWRNHRRTHAWALFDDLAHEAKDSQVRQDARRRQAELEKQIALLALMTRPNARVCLDGKKLDPKHVSARVPLEPGTHEVRVDRRVVELELHAGELRVVHIQDETQNTPLPRPAILGLLGVGAGSSAIAVGFGVSSALASGDSRKKTLAIGGASAAAISLVSAASALALHAKASKASDEDGEEPAPCAPAP